MSRPLSAGAALVPLCSVPCDPDPDPDGVPGSGGERDRCALSELASDYHRASRCLPFAYELRRPEGPTRLEPVSPCR